MDGLLFHLIIILLFLFHLIIILLFLFLVVDLEVAELVGVLGGCHDAEPIAQVVLLQVLFGEILKVTLGESDIGGNN